MKFDLHTLVIVQCLTFTVQAIVLLLQYRVKPCYPGTGWWVSGASVMTLGGALIPMLQTRSYQWVAILANPLMILGLFFLYVGVRRFFGKAEKIWAIVMPYFLFLLGYLYFILVDMNLSARTILVNVTLAAVSILTAAVLLPQKKPSPRKNPEKSGVALLTASVFLLYATFLVVRAMLALLLPPMKDYSDQEISIALSFILAIVASMMWTYGFIILINQRLNMENLLEKEKMQNVFNTGPDAAYISRLSDGVIVDVNERFSAMTGYAREEAIGRSTLEISLWRAALDRDLFLAELEDGGSCENMEVLFGRKDGSRFDGAISAKMLRVYDVPHVICLIRDMTERKQAEGQIQQLIRQLETERNAARISSLTDGLTGLSNRRYFDEALKTEFFREKRYGEELSLIMLDVDFFKPYNDRYGHVAGDDCLRRMAAVFRRIVVRASDIVARYGGEEFVIILPDTGSHGAQELAERIRKAVEALGILHEGSDLSRFVTISLGVVTACPAKLGSPADLVSLVDDALYGAKNGGRNRVKSVVIG